ncbi:hypothetical protein [Zongyangia hominis]|uniref:Uncharacterized protein n=1 Tax=Zongyangia hominis TaxID=2763677 RepID=A0A926I619_9FIRM|nr:hypothetical protein [Zongyangia hominis]MBC8569534.1 hypothetical protein [Zongyangia hominis]
MGKSNPQESGIAGEILGGKLSFFQFLAGKLANLDDETSIHLPQTTNPP